MKGLPCVPGNKWNMASAWHASIALESRMISIICTSTLRVHERQAICPRSHGKWVLEGRILTMSVRESPLLVIFVFPLLCLRISYLFFSFSPNSLLSPWGQGIFIHHHLFATVSIILPNKWVLRTSWTNKNIGWQYLTPNRHLSNGTDAYRLGSLEFLGKKKKNFLS